MVSAHFYYPSSHVNLLWELLSLAEYISHRQGVDLENDMIRFREEKWPPVPDEYRLRKVTALKAVGGRKFNHFPVMTLNEQKHRRRWKIGNWPRAHKA